MNERLRASDYRFILICAALLGATTWFSVRNFYRAFPEASIDFKVNREDALSVAGKFLSGQGYHLEGYRQAAQFTFDEQAKTFLERELGLERANRIMGTRVRLWRWGYRWFRPLEKEEFNVEITPLGQLAGFEHELPEETARPAATAGQARALAEEFLRTRLARDPAGLDFVEATDVARPHRMDRTFTWKERDFQLGDATNRVEVTVLGTEVGGYREYLKIPEQWQRDYQRLRSKNEVASTIDTAVMLLLVVGMVIVIVLRVRRHDVPWRRAALVGVTAIVLAFLAQLNEFPLHEFGYPTTDSYGSFLSREFLNALLAALGAGGLLFILTAGAEPLYREMFGDKISFGNLFTLRGLRTKRFFLGSILGITLTGIFIAYQTGFYIVAYKHGAWSPADVPYTDLLNTKFPWAFVLFGGFLPAVSEEFLFRMFAIPFLRKVTRSMIVAVVLAGFIWGFGHAGYPQQPFYIRGVEVGIGGVALGIVMLRFGILPTLVWHYSVDAMYSAMLLVRSESLYFKLSGLGAAGIMVLPVLIALVAYWRHGGFAPETGLLNRDDAAEPHAPPATPAGAQPDADSTAAPAGEAAPPDSVPYRPLGVRLRWAAAAAFSLGLASLAIPVAHFGESPDYRLSRDRARAASDAFLQSRGLDPAAFQHVTYPLAHWESGDSLAGKYFLERLPVRAASALFERNRPIQVWATRYFKSLDQEEVTVGVHPETGKITGFGHTIPETRPGADIVPERAREIAAQSAASLGWDTAAMDLKESSAEKKKARRDYTLVWEARPSDARNVDQTRWRVEVTVSGDRVTAARGFWKLPEAWQRGRERENALAIIIAVLKIAVIAGLIVYAMWLLIQGTRHGFVRWRAALRLALPATLLFPVAPLLSVGLMMKSYRTDVPLETFQAMTYVSLAMSVIFGFLLMGAAAALVVTFYPDAVPALRRENRAATAFDAVAALLAATGIALLVHRFQGILLDRFHAQAVLSISSPDIVASAAPALAALANAVRGLLTDAALLGLLALLAWQLAKPWTRYGAALLALCATLPSEVRTPGEFLLHYAISLAMAGAGMAFCWFFARRNYLAYALTVWLMALRAPLMQLLGSGNRALEMQAWMVAAIMAATLIWAVAPALRRRGPAEL
ncbi:MAG: CPBP family intramembrane glutamic endopeptidase [Candidatus Solibacter sp.]|jgi:membrane protease YdiL (CAAX protease family)